MENYPQSRWAASQEAARPGLRFYLSSVTALFQLNAGRHGRPGPGAGFLQVSGTCRSEASLKASRGFGKAPGWSGRNLSVDLGSGRSLVLLRSSASTAVKPGDYSSQEFFVSRQTIIVRTRWRRRLPGDPERTCSRPLPPSDAAR